MLDSEEIVLETTEAKETVLYRIETRDEYGRWTPDMVGDSTDNFFQSEVEAEKVIEALRAHDDEWATTEFRVVRSSSALLERKRSV